MDTIISTVSLPTVDAGMPVVIASHLGHRYRECLICCSNATKLNNAFVPTVTFACRHSSCLHCFLSMMSKYQDLRAEDEARANEKTALDDLYIMKFHTCRRETWFHPEERNFWLRHAKNMSMTKKCNDLRRSLGHLLIQYRVERKEKTYAQSVMKTEKEKTAAKIAALEAEVEELKQKLAESRTRENKVTNSNSLFQCDVDQEEASLLLGFRDVFDTHINYLYETLRKQYVLLAQQLYQHGRITKDSDSYEFVARILEQFVYCSETLKKIKRDTFHNMNELYDEVDIFGELNPPYDHVKTMCRDIFLTSISDMRQKMEEMSGCLRRGVGECLKWIHKENQLRNRMNGTERKLYMVTKTMKQLLDRTEDYIMKFENSLLEKTCKDCDRHAFTVIAAPEKEDDTYRYMTEKDRQQYEDELPTGQRSGFGSFVCRRLSSLTEQDRNMTNYTVFKPYYSREKEVMSCQKSHHTASIAASTPSPSTST